MAAYADGLVADPKQGSMLHGLIEVMIRSPYRGELLLCVYVCYNNVVCCRQLWSKVGKV